MEEWQRKHINANLRNLIKSTFCNVELLSELQAENIIERADSENIRKHQTDLEKADQLYTILQTRINGYEKLSKALFECKQTAAFVILLNGMRKHKIKNPFKSCNIKPDLELLATNHVTLRGVFFGVRDWFSKLSDDEFKNKMSTLIQNNAYDVLIRFIQNKRDIHLANDSTFLEVSKYYIPRFISNRLKLSPEIFQQNIDDVFVFRGLSRYELTKLVSKNTESSSSQLTKITANYIGLDNEEDFQDICDIAGGKPVHLISVETEGGERQFILEESTGKSEALSIFVKEKGPDQKCYVSEDNFLDKIDNWEGNHKGFCICDSPGMGKSWLLKNLARKLARRHPDRLIIFTSLVGHMTSGSTLLNTVLEITCPTKLAKDFVLAAIKSGSLKLELFLDGFDEVPEENLQQTKQLIKSISFSEASVRVFVASRRHLRNDLEETLQVIAYDIRPFDEISQADFLVKYWQSTTCIAQTGNAMERLEDFGRACQKQLRSSLSAENLDIMGIPLQCYVLAEVTKSNAARYAKRPNTALSAIIDSFTSVPKMYQAFVNMKLETVNAEMMQMAKNFHLCLALQVFSDDLGMKLENTLKINSKNIPKQILSMGILECGGSDNNIPSFIHRTFAEYFLAELIADVITGKRLMDEENRELRFKLHQFFASLIFSVDVGNFQEIILRLGNYEDTIEDYPWPVINIHEAANSVVVLFLDWHLRNYNTISINFLHECMPAFGTPNSSMTPLKIFKILNFSVKKGYINIIRLLRSYLEHQKLTNQYFDISCAEVVTENFFLTKAKSEVYPISHLLETVTIASAYGSVEVLNEIQNCFKDLFDFDVGEEIAKLPDWLKTPLHFIIARGSYTETEFFLKCISPNLFLRNRALVYHCFSYTVDEPSLSKIKERIEIYKLLYEKAKSVLDEPWYDMFYSRTGTLVYPKLHLEIIKFLLTETNANKFVTVARYTQQLGFLHLAAETLSGDDFYELCQFLENKFPEMSFFQPKSIWVSPLHWVLRYARDFQVQTLQSFPKKLLDEQMNVKDEFGDSLLLSAVFGNRSLVIIKMLIDRGADINIKTGENDNSIMHIAVQRGNIEVTRFLLAHKQSLNQQNKRGETPLHCYDISLEMIKYCVRAGADISLQDENGQTFVHRIVRGVVLCVRHSPERLQEVLELLFDVAKEKTIQIMKTRFSALLNSDDRLYERLIMEHKRLTVKTLKLLLSTFCPKPEELNVNATELLALVTPRRGESHKEKENIIRTLVDYGIALKCTENCRIDEVSRAIQKYCSSDLHNYLLEKNWLQNRSLEGL